MKTKYIAVAGFFIILLSLMVLVPIQTKEANCGLGSRFSMALGQYEKYKEVETKPPYSFACPAYEHDIVPNRLYIL